MSKPLPKSLHTVTVLVNVARHIQSRHGVMAPADAIERALTLLGYSIDADPYGLADAAKLAMGKPGKGYDL